MAEGVGFEPTEGYEPSTVFKTAAFNRSATPPWNHAHCLRYWRSRIQILSYEIWESNEPLTRRFQMDRFNHSRDAIPLAAITPETDA